MRRFGIVFLIIVATIVSILTFALNGSAQEGKGAGCDQGPLNPATAQIFDLDEYADDWGVFCDQGQPTWIKENVAFPSIDGSSLRCGITGGDPYSNLHCYRNLLPEPTAAVFTMTLSFWFSPTTTFNNAGGPSVVQALEFTMNKWHQSKRYEFALQWQNVGPGAPQWRYWDTDQWLSLGIPGIPVMIAGDQRHTFFMQGEIVDEQIYYQRFGIDGSSFNLGIIAPPVSAVGEPDKLAVAVQLDGNFDETPYDMFIDQVSFQRLPPAQVYLPSLIK